MMASGPADVARASWYEAVVAAAAHRDKDDDGEGVAAVVGVYDYRRLDNCAASSSCEL